MWKPELFEVGTFRDGEVVLTCGDEGMETDLVFAASHGVEHPQSLKQREIAEYIVKAVKFYQANNAMNQKLSSP